MFDAAYYFHKELPIKILDKVSKLPGLSTAKLRKTAKLANFVNIKIKELYSLFDHFITNEWIYESKKAFEYMKLMSLEEVADFNVDPKLIDWNRFFHFYAYGAQKYFFKQDVVEPLGDRRLLITKNFFTNFEDVKLSFLDHHIMSTNFEEIRNQVLSSP
jgi:hypothetical protein